MYLIDKFNTFGWWGKFLVYFFFMVILLSISNNMLATYANKIRNNPKDATAQGYYAFGWVLYLMTISAVIYLQLSCRYKFVGWWVTAIWGGLSMLSGILYLYFGFTVTDGDMFSVQNIENLTTLLQAPFVFAMGYYIWNYRAKGNQFSTDCTAWTYGGDNTQMSFY